MNFLDIINKCLVELNYKPVNSFAELTKNEHKKIKNIINLLNNEICLYAKWNFLIRKTVKILHAGTSEIQNDIKGRISQLLIDGENYLPCENTGALLAGKFKGQKVFAFFDNKIKFPVTFDLDKEVEIIYYSLNNAKSSDNVEKDTLENAQDESLIPSPFVEPVLVFGTCMRLKGNPQHIRFNYWLSMYRDALANMVAKCSLDAGFEPSVKMWRK